MKLSGKCRVFAAPFITAVILLIIYTIKGIYPFGDVTIDYYDMAQQIAAFYYHVFDVLHGTKSLFYDPYTALGVNMAMSTSGCSNLSILNLFFLFIKREMLLESLSFFLMLKLMLMSMSMGFYVRRTYKLPLFFEIIFSVTYAFSGFMFVLYVTIQWLDIAILFPLIMYYLKKVLFEKKYILYVIYLSMSLIISYYLSFMILIYIILMTGLFMVADVAFFERKLSENNIYDRSVEKSDGIFLKEKVEYISSKYNLVGLLFSTVISIGISMFIVLPQLRQTLSSARFKNGTDSKGILSVYLVILKNYKPAYTTRWWTLLTLSFCISVIVFGIIKYLKNKKLIVTVVSALLLMSLELFFENINLIWHFGSYVQYPIRNGFIINFTFVVIAAFFVKKMLKDTTIEYSVKSKENKMSKFSIAMIIVTFIICAVTLFVGTRIYSMNEGLPLRKVFHITSAVMTIVFVVYLSILFINKAKFMYVVPIVLASEIVFYGFLLIGKPTFITGYAENPEQEGEYIRICNQLEEAFSLKPDSEGAYLLERIKNPDETLNANYPLVLRRPALTNWTHIISPKLQNSAKKLGYSIEYTRLLDCGGTIFSDALIGIKDVVTCVKQDDKLYDLQDTAEVVTNHLTGDKTEYYYYKCKYKLPFGILINNCKNVFESEDTVDIYNSLFSMLSDSNEKIAQYIYNCETENDVTDLGSKLVLSKEFKVNGNKALYYLSSQTDTQDKNTLISVNEKDILIPSIKEADNYYYPARFNNNAVYLGCFNNENVFINIELYKEETLAETLETEELVYKPRIIAIDIDKLDDLCKTFSDNENYMSIKAKTNGYDIEVYDNSKDYVCLPVSYDEGFDVKIDGKKSVYNSLGDIFTIIKVNGGKHISMKFKPSVMSEGVIISILSIIISIIYLLSSKLSIISNAGFVYKEVNMWMNGVCLAGYIVILIFMYVIPVISGVILWIM